MLTSKTFARWDLKVIPFHKVRRRLFWTRYSTICCVSLRRLKKQLSLIPLTKWSLDQKHFSSNIIYSPFLAGDIPKVLIPDLILDVVDKFPEATSLRCGLTGRSYTYAELHKLSQRFRKSLVKSGFLPGDVMAIVMSNSPEFAIVVMGALQADLTLTFMNHAYTSVEMNHQLQDSGSLCVISGEKQLAYVQATVDKLKANGSDRIRKIIVMDIPSLEFLPRGVARFSEAIADDVDHTESSKNRATPRDIAAMPYSSGTMGLPKGVLLSHSNIVSCLHQLSYSGVVVGDPADQQDLILGLLPFYHIYGFLILANGLRSGCQIITLPNFKPDHFISTLENEKLRMLFLVPPLVLFLATHPAIRPDLHLADVRLLVSGADMIDSTTLERMKARLMPECNLAQAYGMTETCGFAAFPVFPIKNFFTCGAPAALTEARIACVETGKFFGPNQTGELHIRGPQNMIGYKNPEQTGEIKDSDGWIHTGDLAYYDEDKHLYLEGRLKELIKVKGFQVAPAELEGLLKEVPGVLDVAVIGVPDQRTGETPVAFMVKSRESSLTEEEVIRFVASKVISYKRVSEVIFVDKIPKSSNGKVRRNDLKDMFKEGKKF